MVFFGLSYMSWPFSHNLIIIKEPHGFLDTHWTISRAMLSSTQPQLDPADVLVGMCRNGDVAAIFLPRWQLAAQVRLSEILMRISSAQILIFIMDKFTIFETLI